MTTRKGINISGTYVVRCKLDAFHICTLYSKNMKGRI